MENKERFYVCDICGNIITKLNDSGVPVVCCGEPMGHISARDTKELNDKIELIKVTFSNGEIFAYNESTGLLRKGDN